MDMRKAYKFIQYMFYIDKGAFKKHNKTNEDLKKELNLGVLMLGLMKSGQLWRNIKGQRGSGQ